MQSANRQIILPAEPPLRFVRDPNRFGGVCSGLAPALDTEAWVLRAAFIVAVFCFGTGVLFYLSAMICLPRADRAEDARKPRILGVCSRISAASSGLEVGLCRLIAFWLILLSAGSGLFAYVLLALIVPWRE